MVASFCCGGDTSQINQDSVPGICKTQCKTQWESRSDMGSYPNTPLVGVSG